jgi:hypothetical protein
VADLQAKKARLDNRSWRRILPSTSAMADAIECLCESGGGGKGPKGDTGAAGKDGLGIDDVHAKFVPCDIPPDAKLVIEPNNQRVLELTIPGCCNTNLTHICGINWKHNELILPVILFETGLLVSFDGTIEPADVHPESVKLLAPMPVAGGIEWAEINLKALRAVNITTAMNASGTCNINIRTVHSVDATHPANGIQVVAIPVQRFDPHHPFRLVIDGDFIRSKDKNGVIRAVDIDHLPPWLSGDQQGNVTGRLTGDGIEGGTFISYFKVEG